MATVAAFGLMLNIRVLGRSRFSFVESLRSLFTSVLSLVVFPFSFGGSFVLWVSFLVLSPFAFFGTFPLFFVFSQFRPWIFKSVTSWNEGGSGVPLSV